MSLRVLRSCAAFALSTTAFATLAVAQVPPTYHVEFLGSTIGASALNEAGELVGTTTSGVPRAWIASSGSPLVHLPLPAGRVSSLARDINDLGVVVGAVSSASSAEFSGIAAAWYPDGIGGYTVVELGALPGHASSRASALNNVGDIVGFSSNGTFRYPVRFAAGGVQDLSATGVFDPVAINDQRVLVDSSASVKRLDLDTMTVQDLGLPQGLPQNYTFTSAFAINASGQVAGDAVLATSTNCNREAALYTDGSGWEILSICGVQNGARDLNDLGDVVMQLNLASYVKFSGIGTYRLEDLVENTIGHWSLINTFGLAINDARQIATSASNSATGESGVVLLTPIGSPSVAYCFGDGSGALCPCGNPGSAGHGCANGASSAGAALTSSGVANTLSSSLVLSGSGLAPGQSGLYFQGENALAGLPFGDGLRCVGGTLVRLQVRTANASGTSQTTVVIAAKGGVAPGQTRRYQLWYRDTASICGTGFNLSNGVEIVWAP